MEGLPFALQVAKQFEQANSECLVTIVSLTVTSIYEDIRYGEIIVPKPYMISPEWSQRGTLSAVGNSMLLTPSRISSQVNQLFLSPFVDLLQSTHQQPT